MILLRCLISFAWLQQSVNHAKVGMLHPSGQSKLAMQTQGETFSFPAIVQVLFISL